MSVTCPYCSKQSLQVIGRLIYPHRDDLFNAKFWLCAPCDAYVGCHPNGQPLGRLANAALRLLKRQAHDAFDPLWATVDAMRLAYPNALQPDKTLQQVMRKRAYAWLAAQMRIAVDDCHIGAFDDEQCRRVVEIVRLSSIDAAVVRRWAKERRAA